VLKDLSHENMSVKSISLNGFINEEVDVSQPPSFEYNKHVNHV